MATKQIYRQKALEQLQSPEELDRLLVVVNRKSWLVLLTFAAISITAILWSIFGRIPVRLDGAGVLVNPGNVRPVQSPATGQVTSIELQVGQHVNQGAVIARLDQPELRKQLEQLLAQREDTLAFHATETRLDEQRRELESKSYAGQRTFIEDEVRAARDLTEQLDQTGESYRAVQSENLDKAKQLTNKLNGSLEKQLDTLKDLKRSGLVSSDLVLNAETSMADSELRMADLEVQRQGMQLSEIQWKRSKLEQENRLADLALKLMQLDISAQRLTQELIQKREERKTKILELDNAIARIGLRLKRESEIISDCNGKILEVNINPGQLVGLGTRVGMVEMDDANSPLTNLSYFRIRDGKRISIGDAARITPATVERERDGSMVGVVTSVSSFPITQESVVKQIGNDQIAQSLIQQGGAIAVEIQLQPDPQSVSGYRWTSKGPDKQFSAGTTTTVRVTIDERAPITYLLPFLKTWFFGKEKETHPE